jgi:hypothetical protein
VRRDCLCKTCESGADIHGEHFPASINQIRGKRIYAMLRALVLGVVARREKNEEMHQFGQNTSKGLVNRLRLFILAHIWIPMARVTVFATAPGRLIDVLTSGGLLPTLAIWGMTLLCACTTSSSSVISPGSAREPKKESQLSKSPSQKPVPGLVQSEDHHVYVTSEGLNGNCYEDLGQVSLNESYAQSVTEDTGSQAQRLRAIARENYADKVDAVINVHEQQNEAGTTVEVSGEAVHLKNHETVACAARAMPPVIDSAAATAAGGMFGTMVGGLVGGPGYAAGAGVLGASAVAGREIVKHHQQQQANEILISDRLQQQQSEIAQLYQQLTKLIGQQCESEELSEQECEQRIVAVQRQIANTNGGARTSAPTDAASGSASADATTQFGILNRMQEQQETIDQLQRRIAQIKQAGDAP